MQTQSEKQSPISQKLIADHMRYESAQKFIKIIGGENAANEIIDAGESFICFNWTKYNNNQKFYFARVAKISPMDVRLRWTDMDKQIREQLSSGLIDACHIAAEILAHPPEQLSSELIDACHKAAEMLVHPPEYS